MTLEDYLRESTDEEPANGTVGVETDWMPVATLKVATGALWIGDPQFAWAEANEGEGCVAEVPIGDYLVEAKGINFAGRRFVWHIQGLPLWPARCDVRRRVC